MREGDDPVTRTDRSSLRVLGTVGEPINPEAWEWYFHTVGDDAISRFFDQRVEEMLAQIKTDVVLSVQVKSAIGKKLSGGVPKLSDIALGLGMSARTLQRKLSDDGVVFQELVDQARRELAEKLLRTTNFPLVEIAFLTGFAEQSGFTRAFKRWAGETPRSYRLGSTPN